MPKPVLTLMEDPSLTSAINQNRLRALALVLFFNFHHPIKHLCLRTEILPQLCQLSYTGDIRMKYKMENPNKVKNIVEGQEDQLVEIYEPFLRELESEGIIRL